MKNEDYITSIKFIDEAVQAVVYWRSKTFVLYFYYFNLTGLRNCYGASVSAENELNKKKKKANPWLTRGHDTVWSEKYWCFCTSHFYKVISFLIIHVCMWHKCKNNCLRVVLVFSEAGEVVNKLKLICTHKFYWISVCQKSKRWMETKIMEGWKY